MNIIFFSLYVKISYVNLERSVYGIMKYMNKIRIWMII